MLSFNNIVKKRLFQPFAARRHYAPKNKNRLVVTTEDMQRSARCSAKAGKNIEGVSRADNQTIDTRSIEKMVSQSVDAVRFSYWSGVAEGENVDTKSICTISLCQFTHARFEFRFCGDLVFRFL